jgi:2-oxoisovalerate dehydrogenase E1 component
MARVDGRVVVFLEPIALYMTKDLHASKDGAWQFPYPPPGWAVPFGEGRVYHETATELLIVTYGNGTHMSLQAAARLQQESGFAIRVLELRWLNPLNVGSIARHAAECGRVLVVDEGRRTGGIGEAIITAVAEHGGRPIPVQRVVGEDSYIPLGPAANLVLPTVEAIVAAARELCPEPRAR